MKKILIIFMVVGIISCIDTQPFDLDEFDSKVVAWKALNIDAYLFTAQSSYSAHPTIPVTVTVLQGMEPELSYELDDSLYEQNYEQNLAISEGRPFTPYHGLTIDELFDSIRKRILASSNSDTISIRYNKEFHYPESFHTSTGKRGGYSGLEITYFEVLR